MINDKISDIIERVEVPGKRVYKTDSEEGMLNKDAINIVNYFKSEK